MYFIITSTSSVFNNILHTGSRSIRQMGPDRYICSRCRRRRRTPWWRHLQGSTAGRCFHQSRCGNHKKTEETRGNVNSTNVHKDRPIFLIVHTVFVCMRRYNAIKHCVYMCAQGHKHSCIHLLRVCLYNRPETRRQRRERWRHGRWEWRRPRACCQCSGSSLWPVGENIQQKTSQQWES